MNNVVYYLSYIFICDLQNFNARCIFLILFLNKNLFLSLLNKDYFKRYKKTIIAASTRRREYARRYENIYACERHNYKTEIYITLNSIICDTYYLIILIILTNVDVIIQKCIREITTKNVKTFSLILNTLNNSK